jgi:hypothetical protein
MTTAIEDGELNTELQQLYLESKQWIADLDFLDSELAFLKKLAENLTSESTKKEDIEKLAGIEKIYTGLKEDMQNYLRQLGPLITRKNEVFDLSLVETYSALKVRLNDVLNNCQSVKITIFGQSKQGFYITRSF